MKANLLARILLILPLSVTAALAQTSAAPAAHSGVDLSAIDRAADPCNDFFQYACGTWIKEHPIPADESSWGRFNELYNRNQETLREILEDSAKHQDRSEIDQKIGGFYQSCMNEAAIEVRGITPLQPELDRITHLSTPSELAAEVARLHQQQVGARLLLSR
jgi:putative endopeptidase